MKPEKDEVILQECWVWPEKVADFVKDKIKGYSLNVCAGRQIICNENVDLYPELPEISKADMRKLPFNNNTFDTVVSDPPWKIGYYQRFRPFFECVRVCKIGGTIIYNAYWLPVASNVKLIGTYIRQDTEFSNASIIGIFEKISEDPEIKGYKNEKDTQEVLIKSGGR